MGIEDKYLIALAVLCVLLLGFGTIFARWLSHASPRTMRTVWPIAAMLTGAIFAVFVFVARSNVKG